MLCLAEVLEKCAEFKKKSERVEALQANAELQPAIKTVMEYMFNPNIVFVLPEGAPQYRPSEFDEPGRFYSELRKMYLFVEGGHPGLTKLRRESLFVELLESIHPKDAELLLAMKDKTCPYKGITKDVAMAAFPELFPT